MLQVRVSVPSFASGINFTDPVILENAEDITLRKRVNSSDEGISFSVPPFDAKAQYVVYTRWWECWDTSTGERLNFGPIDNIQKSSGDRITVTGSGRSSVLKDFVKSIQTFYMPIDIFLDNLRYENIATSPRTDTIIDKTDPSDYYGLSKRTKINAVDEQTGYIAIGRDSPDRGTLKTSRFWTGTGKADWLTVDLGSQYQISKARFLFPWWGATTIQNGRAYDWNLQTSNDNSAFTTIHSTDVPNYHTTDPRNSEFGQVLYFGESGFESDQITVSGAPLSARYFKVDITDTHAWYGGSYGSAHVDQWDYECGGVDLPGPPVTESPTDGTIPKREIAPESDCYASIVEIGLLRKILGRDTITSTAYKQIENDNLQILYYHIPAASEMITTGTPTVRKFEPGTFFRKIAVTWSGGNISISDEYNTIVWTSGGSSGTAVPVNLPAFTRVIRITGSSNSTVVYCDAWQGKVDPLSYGATYSYTTILGDYAVLRMRGSSVKWFATVPSTATAAQVKIEQRSKNDTTGAWSSWTTLETALTLPIGINAEKVWEITEESGSLTTDVTYEFKFTNQNGGYLSIDAFAGFWVGSFTVYNEDNNKYAFRKPQEAKALYEIKHSRGSIYEYRTKLSPAQSLLFIGDRVVVFSRKGPGYGSITLGLLSRAPDGPYGGVTVPIPGGDTDGRLTIDLDSTDEVPQAVIFDSDEYFTSPGLPWGHYWLGVYSAGGDPVYLDGMGVHESAGLSVKFVQTTHLDILKSVAEALQMEWDITEAGIKVVPRIGTTTYEVLKEGTNTTIEIQEVQDVEQVATMLHVSGGDIDGLPLTAVVEDKLNKNTVGRTVHRLYDLRSVLDYFTLIGAARTELRKRRYPQRRIAIRHIGPLPIELGDDFIAKTATYEHRVRAMSIERNQSSGGGTSYELECVEWPQIP